MKSIAELEAIRKKTLERTQISPENDTTRIIVGLATCGIAAGARKVMNHLADQIKEKGISNATVSLTGCIGMCRLEPIVDVIRDGKKVTYVNVDEAMASRIVEEHVIGGQPITQYTIGYFQANNK